MKPLTPEEEAAFNSVLRRAVERMERRQKNGFATEEEAERLNEAVGTVTEKKS
jgi:Arc/MetJ family transcription regulator